MLAFLCGMIVIVTAARAEELNGAAESTPAVSPSLDSFSISEAQARSSVQWLADLAIEKVPRHVDGDKNWGQTKKIWAGVKMRLDGLKLKTHRRYRDVEHGRWIKYQVTFPNPASPDAATVTIHRVTPTVDPAGWKRWNITSSVVSPVTFQARIQRWNLGVRLYSTTVSGVMRVRLRSSASIGFTADYSEIPPALVIDPRITDAQLTLDSFQVGRVSRIGGEVAEGWGEVLQEVLVDRLIDKQNDRLVSKLNRMIEKERDDLRLSMSDWLIRSPDTLEVGR